MPDKKLTVELPEDLLREIDNYREETHKDSTSAAVVELLKSALVLPDYFRNFDWEAAEKEADESIKTGELKSFDIVDDFIADLKS